MWLGKLKRLDRSIDECSGMACDVAQSQFDTHLYSLPFRRPCTRLEIMSACTSAVYLVRHGNHEGEPEAVRAEHAIRLVARAVRSRDPQAAALMRRLPSECSGLTGSEAQAVEAIARGAGPR